MKKRRKNKGGRPGKYYTHVEPRFIEIEGWARDGLTDEQIAHNLGVAYSTFREYKKKYSALSAALKKGKDVVDREVENALLKRALGYQYEEKTYEKVWNPTLEKYVTVNTKTVTKEVQPDTTAQIFWLKNRKPEQWRDKRDIEHKGSLEVKNDDIRRIEQQLEKDDESRELLKEFFRRSKEISEDGEDIS